MTTLLFTFNRFSNSVLFGKTFIGLKDELSGFNKFDLLVVSKKTEIKSGDSILFYDTNKGKNFLDIESVQNVMTNDNGVLTYVIRGDEYLADDYVIGKATDVKSFAFLGLLYIVFTSKIGYLVFAILPIVLYFAFCLRKYKKL